ncbi:MAG: ATP-binding cassette domain-containing protein [Candidatus Diapherotrites archaeon]|nr:ATP-binding cassette domain-containing protein [Candidatus Diapherotrites archaeon]
MLEISGLNISFGAKNAVRGFSLRAGEKERIAIIGGNGSGKTTIALFLAGVIPQFLPGRVEGRFSGGGKIGLLLQDPSSQFLSLTVRDELEGAQLQRFSLKHLLEKSVFELSEGEKQQVNLAANVLRKCDTLVMDEPLELLDPIEARRFKEIISGLKGKTILWFDKSSIQPKGWKKVFLEKLENPALPKKKPAAEKAVVVLEADFSVRRNGFSMKNISLRLRDSEKIALIGPNGGGKTTLLKAIAGALKANGRVVSKKRFSYAPQNPTSLFFEETVEAELFSRENAGLLGISHLLGSNPTRLSKGQQKLASIAAVAPGTIALLDEPTTWLDDKNKRAVYNFINNSCQAMIIATHDAELLRYCNRVFSVERGVVRECSATTAKAFFRAGRRQ